MKNKEKSVNRKALPKFFGVILISALIGGVLGGVFTFADGLNLSKAIPHNIICGALWKFHAINAHP